MRLNQSKYRLGITSDLKIDNLFIVFSYLLSVFPLLPFGIRTILMIIWSLLGVFLFSKNKKFQVFRSDKFILVSLIASFVFLVVSLTYSNDVSEGIKRITKIIPIIIFPLIFYLNQNTFTKLHINWILKLFCIAVIIMVLYQYSFLIFNYEIITNDLSLIEIKRNNLHHLSKISEDQIQQVKIRRLRNFIMEIVDTHPTYQGLWISFTVCWLIFIIKSKKILSRNTVIIILGVVVLIFWMFLISARMPIIASFAAIVLTWIVFRGTSIKTFLASITILIALLFSLFTFVKPINTKTKEIVDNVFKLPTTGNDIYNFNSTNVRSGIYYCDAILVSENWLFGTGIGDMQNELSNCYENKIGAKIYKWQTYNSHNQYLFFLIGSGILSLFSFMTLLFFLFKKLVKQGHSLLFFGLVVISIVMLTENLISRSDGALFFGLFVSMTLLVKNKYHLQT